MEWGRCGLPARVYSGRPVFLRCARGNAAGAGLCVMMEEVGDREPKVRRVLPKKAPCFPFPSWLTSHRELATSRRIRVVYDFVASAFVAL